MEKQIIHVVGFSGGIDSQACARWVLNRFPDDEIVLLNSDAGGNEHPMTTEFIKWYSENIHPVIELKAKVKDLGTRGTKQGATKERRDKYDDNEVMTFDMLAEIKGLFPASKMQFCTEHLKLAPQHRWMKENLNGKEWRRYTGVRRDESRKRKNATIGGWDDYFGCELIQPITDWTKKMCFDYVEAHGEDFNGLYKLGFDRVGCSPCVNSSKYDIFNWSKRFPEMIDKVRGWEERTDLPFFRKPFKNGTPRFIDDVVAWANTTHGGKQGSLEVLYKPSVCESNYGLCE